MRFKCFVFATPAFVIFRQVSFRNGKRTKVRQNESVRRVNVHIADILKEGHARHLQEARRFLQAKFFVGHLENQIIIRDARQTYLQLDQDATVEFLKMVDVLEGKGLAREIALNALASRFIQEHLQLTLTFSDAQGRKL